MYLESDYERLDGWIGENDYQVCMELGMRPTPYHSFRDNLEERGDCLVWTGSTITSGNKKKIKYGLKQWNAIGTKYKQVGTTAHRLYLMFKLGRRLGPGMDAAHHCGNSLCVRHVSEITHEQNVGADKHRDGTLEDQQKGEDRYNAKLTEKQVKQIWKRMQKGEKTTDIAKDYPHSSLSTLYSIKNGYKWNSVTKLPRKRGVVVKGTVPVGMVNQWIGHIVDLKNRYGVEHALKVGKSDMKLMDQSTLGLVGNQLQILLK